MNIFIVENDPVLCARSLCDKHVISQTKESAQMLSTAHRISSGIQKKVYVPDKGKLMTRWIIPDETNEILYQVSHASHPCSIWTRKSSENYDWHYAHFVALASEYTYRFGGKIHQSFSRLGEVLKNPPKSLPKSGLTPFALAINSDIISPDISDPIGSYRRFYLTKRDRFNMIWTSREVPNWFCSGGKRLLHEK